MSALAVGFGLGFFVGSQPGPVSLLCVRSVLRGAFTTGVAIGAGAALIDLLYAGLGLAGAASLLEIDALRVALGALGALVLAAIFAAASTASLGGAGGSAGNAALLLAGVACGTLTAFTALSALVALVRGRFGPRLLTVVDAVAGAGLLGFAGVLGWRTAHDA